MRINLIGILLIFLLLSACTNVGSNQINTNPKKDTSALIKADSFVIQSEPENLQNSLEIDVLVRNDGRFDNKEIMLVMYNCKNEKLDNQGGLGIKASNQYMNIAETKVFKAIFTAEQSVPIGKYSCELIASATSGESVSTILKFEII